jgi:ABC-type multidrug transport system fused ATPase/permease subunit
MVMPADAENPSAPPPRLPVSEFLRIGRLAKAGRTTPPLVLLGLAASFLETLGITLVVLFLHVMLTPEGPAKAEPGGLNWLLEQLASVGVQGVGLAVLVLMLIAGRAAVGYGYATRAATVKAQLAERVLNGLHRQYVEVAYSQITAHDQGTLLNLIATLSWSVPSAYLSFTRVIVNICAVMVFAGFLLALSWQITLAAAVGSTLLFVGLSRLSARVRTIGAHANEVNHALAEQTLLTLQGLRTIRAFGQEATFHAAFEAASGEARRTDVRLERLHAAIGPISEIAYLGLLCAIVAVAEWQAVPFATTFACVALLYRLQPHAREMQGNLLHMASLEPSLRQVMAMLDRSDKVYPTQGWVPFAGLQQDLRFDGVCLTHRDSSHPALEGASFVLKAGGVTALVGDSGAGKTTVVNMLIRLYEPDAGSILVNGEPLGSLRRADWLSRVALAGQDVELVEGTVADNIRMARPEASTDEVVEAAELAGVTEFVHRLTEGFDSWIGQAGLNLSGGQRQRIALARAVLRNPGLLILDEATNALDGRLEDEVRRRILAAFAGRTIVIITHRLETVLEADHIICLEAGRVTEAGPPRQLAAQQDGALVRMLAGMRAAASH